MPDPETATPRRIICNPADDDRFVRTVENVAAAQGDATRFRASLRTRYPKAALDVSALAGEEIERWYVYRDGHWAGDGTGIVDITLPSASSR